MFKIREWIYTQLLYPRQNCQRRALLLTGKSSVGKTSFFDFFFRKIFGTVNLNLDKSRKFADGGCYDKYTNLWCYPDVNRNIHMDNLLQLQNIIDGVRSLEIKYKSVDSKGLTNRPVVICSTIDLLKRIDKLNG